MPTKAQARGNRLEIGKVVVIPNNWTEVSVRSLSSDPYNRPT